MKTKGKCILIVDDEPPIQRVLRRNLTMSSYDVLIADNGVQALELVRLHEPDLILLDLWLPGEMDGMSVCVQVRQWSQVPIIVVSARTDEKQKVQALDKGADDYLTKPFNNDELLARVRACLRRPEYGEETDYIRVYVRQLRLKIEKEPSQPKYIQTEPGVGYVFRPQVILTHVDEVQSAISTTTLLET